MFLPIQTHNFQYTRCREEEVKGSKKIIFYFTLRLFFFLLKLKFFFFLVHCQLVIMWEISTLKVADRLKLYLIYTPVLYVELPPPHSLYEYLSSTRSHAQHHRDRLRLCCSLVLNVNFKCSMKKVHFAWQHSESADLCWFSFEHRCNEQSFGKSRWNYDPTIVASAGSSRNTLLGLHNFFAVFFSSSQIFFLLSFHRKMRNEQGKIFFLLLSCCQSQHHWMLFFYRDERSSSFQFFSMSGLVSFLLHAANVRERERE